MPGAPQVPVRLLERDAALWNLGWLRLVLETKLLRERG